MIQLGHYLVLSSLVFGIGATGFLIRRNALIQLMCIELMLNAVNLMLVAFNRWNPENHAGQRFAFFVIAVMRSSFSFRSRLFTATKTSFGPPSRAVTSVSSGAISR